MKDIPIALGTTHAGSEAAIDPAKPHQPMPEAAYGQIITLPEEVIWKMAPYAEPPVKVEGKTQHSAGYDISL